MSVWQLQEAKAQLTKLIKASKIEPQIISRHGVCETIVMSVERYQELLGKKEDIVQFFKNSPLNGVDLVCERDHSPQRETEL